MAAANSTITTTQTSTTATSFTTNVTNLMSSIINEAAITLATTQNGSDEVSTSWQNYSSNETYLMYNNSDTTRNSIVRPTTVLSGSPTSATPRKAITFLDFEVILPCIFGIFIILSMSMVVFYTKVSDEKDSRRPVHGDDSGDCDIIQGRNVASGRSTEENGSVPKSGHSSHYSYTVPNGVVSNGYAY